MVYPRGPAATETALLMGSELVIAVHAYIHAYIKCICIYTMYILCMYIV